MGETMTRQDYLGLNGRIGPHEGCDQIEMVARGEKPAALFSCHFRDENRRRELNQRVREHGLTIYVFEFYKFGQEPGTMSGIVDYVVARTADEARTAARAIKQSALENNHAEIGRILGYTEADIRLYYKVNNLGTPPSPVVRKVLQSPIKPDHSR
jgi:hypothetical protein